MSRRNVPNEPTAASGLTSEPFDFYRLWAEGMGGDEEKLMMNAVRVFKAASRVVAQPFNHIRADDLIELREALDAVR